MPVRDTFLKRLTFGPDGLIPAIVQNHTDNEILMMAYMNREAVLKTLATREIHFWSRSRKSLWRKGDTSGNRMALREIRIDCDGDALLVRVEPRGPACHTGEWSCFFRSLSAKGTTRVRSGPAKSLILDRVYDVISDRKRRPKPKSYVTRLFKTGRDLILKKIAEESGELIIGSKNGRRSEIIWETADLWFHSLVLLGYHDIRPSDIFQELQSRTKEAGRPSNKGRP